MNLFVEVASFFAGAITEYAKKKKWSAYKIFFFPMGFFSFFCAVSLFFIPSENSLFVMLLYSFLFGVFSGVVFLLLFYFGKIIKQ